MQPLVACLNQKGYHTKTWIFCAEQLRGGNSFQKSSIQRILINPVYIEKVAHYIQSKSEQGKHEVIVSLWIRADK